VTLGLPEIVIVLVIALLIFGPKRLPQMGRTLGRGVREFRKASDDITSSFSFSDDDEHDEDGERTRVDAGAVEPAALEPAAAVPDEADAAPKEPAAPAAGGPGTT
jgi:sec-independent protein translocase protein TatA